MSMLHRAKLVVNDKTVIGDIIENLDFEFMIEWLVAITDDEYPNNVIPKQAFGKYVAIFLKETINVEIKKSTWVSDTNPTMSWNGTVIDDIAKILTDLKLIGIKKVNVEMFGTIRAIDHYMILHRN